jgi:mono/diheme cytochrome c family protein
MYKKFSLLFVFMLVISLLVAGCGAKATEAPAGTEVADITNSNQPGEAINLTGDPTAGAGIFRTKCAECHGKEGKGGQANPGSEDGTIPPLNPVEPDIKSPDAKTFATTLDLYIEHGSKPEGDNPTKLMTAFGDKKMLTPQQIADVIAYIMSLNK